MLAIIRLLKARKRMTAKELAETLEIHVRTVYRYIDALCASGIPVVAHSGHNGGYSLLPHFTEMPLFFDLSEQKALIHAAIFAKEAGYPFSDALNRAISKLRMYANQEQRDEIDRHAEGFEVIHPPADVSLNPILQELETSAANRRTLVIEYQKGWGTAPPQTRRIDPYGIVYWKGRWYVVAYCHLRGEIRSFRADRIKKLTRTDHEFQRPELFSARRFFLKNLLPDPMEEERTVTVRIKGNSRAIEDLCGHWLFGHALVERLADEALFKLDERIVHAHVPYLLLGYGKSLSVAEPPDLRERLAAVAEELSQYYRS